MYWYGNNEQCYKRRSELYDAVFNILGTTVRNYNAVNRVFPIDIPEYMFEYLVKKKHIRFLDTATIGQRYGWGKRNISQVSAIKLTGGFVIKMGVRYDGSVDWAYIEDSWHNFDSFYKNGFDV
jgi:hypothetical protein